jgi:probable F420-dependent oxidoreductase
MKFGVNCVGVRPELWVEVACRAEELGFDSVFIPEHVVFPVDPQGAYPYNEDGSFPYNTKARLYDPWVLLGHIAAVTSRIKLGTAVFLLPLRHPFLVARSVTTLDVLSNGRAMLGIGVGWLQDEFDLLGQDFHTRGARTNEAIQVLRALWREEAPEFHGRFFDFPPVHFEPKPPSDPHPPILVGGESPAAIGRAVRLGDGWIAAGQTQTVDDTERRARDVRARRAEANPEPFEITILGEWREPDDLARLEAAGVDRLLVTPWARGREIFDTLEEFPSEILGR